MFLLVPAHPGSPGQRAIKRLCVCVCVCVLYNDLDGIFQSELQTTNDSHKQCVCVLYNDLDGIFQSELQTTNDSHKPSHLTSDHT